jgi:hypothetical protein
VRFDDVPEFGQRYTVMATGENDDEETVRQFLTPEARRGLIGFRFWRLMAGGDGLAIREPTYLVKRGAERCGAFQALLEEALRVAEILGPAAPALRDARM